MKFFSGFLGLAILVVSLGFALSNRGEVTVVAWPLKGEQLVPLYVVGLAPLAFGLIFGSLWGWLSNVPHRFRAYKLGKELNSLKASVSDAGKKSFWGGK